MKKYCVFPDQSKFELHSILDVSETHTCIAYYDDNLPQILWVPNDFITND